MAAMIASRVSKRLEKLRFYPIRSAVAALTPFRSFSSAETRDVAGDTRTLDIDRRTDVSPVPRGRRRRGDLFPSFFSDVFDPFSPTQSLSQVLNLMDQMLESPFASVRGMRPRGWDAREEEDALYLSVEMPGLGKEDVSVTVEQNTLVIKGEGGEEEGKGEEEGRGRRRYSSRIDLPPNLYKIDGIKAEMKNGVLKLVVPKAKDGERRDVVQVQIE